jgi:hypothetical protein
MKWRTAKKNQPGTKSGKYLKQSRSVYYRYMVVLLTLSSQEYFGSWAKIAMDSATESGATEKLQKHWTSWNTLTLIASCIASTDLTSTTMTTRMTSNKCFSGNWHVWLSLLTSFTRTNMQDGYKKGAQAQSVLENAQDTSGRLDATTKASEDGAGYSWGGQTAQYTNHHGVQSMQEQECQLEHLVPAAALIFHHK